MCAAQEFFFIPLLDLLDYKTLLKYSLHTLGIYQRTCLCVYFAHPMQALSISQDKVEKSVMRAKKPYEEASDTFLMLSQYTEWEKNLASFLSLSKNVIELLKIEIVSILLEFNYWKSILFLSNKKVLIRKKRKVNYCSNLVWHLLETFPEVSFSQWRSSSGIRSWKIFKWLEQQPEKFLFCKTL